MTDPQAEAELMPCPFCRSDNVALDTVMGEPRQCWVACFACKADGPVTGDAQSAIAAWNRRDPAFALAQRRLATEAERWQPIETAPKDGTPVLVCRDMGNPWGWVRGWSRWVDVRGISGWLSHGMFDVPGDLGLGNPTHWQPLPAPPAAILAPDPETKP
jgi:Lar family restriction alleviation protein